jgi:hypothetical protein
VWPKRGPKKERFLSSEIFFFFDETVEYHKFPKRPIISETDWRAIVNGPTLDQYVSGTTEKLEINLLYYHQSLIGYKFFLSPLN